MIVSADVGHILGIIAGVLIFSSYSFYVLAIIRGTTKPNRATWFMLAVISTVIAASYYDVGAQNTWWVAVGAALGTSFVALLSVRYGSGGKTLFDRLCILVGIGSLIFYFLSTNPLVTLLLTLVMDGAAMLPTIRHAALAPHEEDKFAWTLTAVGDILAIIVIDQWTFGVAVYPFYMLLINGAVVLLIYQPAVAKFFMSKTISGRSS